MWRALPDGHNAATIPGVPFCNKQHRHFEHSLPAMLPCAKDHKCCLVLVALMHCFELPAKVPTMHDAHWSQIAGRSKVRRGVSVPRMVERYGQGF
jgi:hypothetical protein